MAKAWTAEEIREKVATDDQWLVRGLVAIYNRQTEDEKIVEGTKHQNGIGFNGVDAGILSSFAQQYQTKGWLSQKQKDLARKKMGKYVGQLFKIANGDV